MLFWLIGGRARSFTTWVFSVFRASVLKTEIYLFQIICNPV